MKCPFCSFDDTRVIDSRETKNGTAIRRRRQCVRCEGRFSTYEETEMFQFTVVKRDGRKEEYNREKLKGGIVRAFEKRPNGVERVATVLEAVETRLQTLETNSVSAREIGRLVSDVLRETDEVAYLRFVSVYRAFGSAKSFRKEIDKIEEESK